MQEYIEPIRTEITNILCENPGLSPRLAPLLKKIGEMETALSNKIEDVNASFHGIRKMRDEVIADARKETLFPMRCSVVGLANVVVEIEEYEKSSDHRVKIRGRIHNLERNPVPFSDKTPSQITCELLKKSSNGYTDLVNTKTGKTFNESIERKSPKRKRTQVPMKQVLMDALK